MPTHTPEAPLSEPGAGDRSGHVAAGPIAVAADTASYLTQDDAAALCGKSRDTIRRYRRTGLIKNWRRRNDGVVEVAVADLVATGLLDPLAALNVDDLANRTRGERDLHAVRQKLALAEARITDLQERLERADDEIRFLRSIVANAPKVA